MTLNEILNALAPLWQYANETDIDGKFLRLDYRQALTDAWRDIVVAYEAKPKDSVPHVNLNVAIVRRVPHG